MKEIEESDNRDSVREQFGDAVKGGIRTGAKGFARVLMVVFLFMILNAVLLFYAMRSFNAAENSNYVYFGIIVFACLGFIVFAGFKAYKSVLIDGMRMVFVGSSDILHKISAGLVDNMAENIANQGEGLKEKDAFQYVEKYFIKLPSPMRIALTWIVKRVPLTQFIHEVLSEIKAGNKAAASEHLFTNINDFVLNTLLENKPLRFLLWLLPLNLLVVLLLTSFGT